MSTTDVQKAQAALLRAEAKAQAAREAAERAAAHEAERRARQMERWDRQVLSLYSPEGYEHAVREAQEALQDALDNDPVVSAAVRLRTVQGLRHGSAVLAHSIRQRLGMDPVPIPPPGAVALESVVARYVEARGSELVADAEDDFNEAREQAAASDD